MISNGSTSSSSGGAIGVVPCGPLRPQFVLAQVEVCKACALFQYLPELPRALVASYTVAQYRASRRLRVGAYSRN
eukprot:524212-Rhodomonas_salina.2